MTTDRRISNCGSGESATDSERATSSVRTAASIISEASASQPRFERKRDECRAIEKRGWSWAYKPVALTLGDVDSLLQELAALRADLAAAEQERKRLADLCHQHYHEALRALERVRLLEVNDGGPYEVRRMR